MFLRYIDLSRVDFLTGNTTEQNTANCYVVRRQGNYKFPIVYGNSIKEGKENKDSFEDFYPIIKPGVISDEEWAEGGDICAKVLWSDSCNIILPNYPSIDFKHRYIKFKFRVTDQKKPGNLVIGLFRNGICGWCWHIWYYPGEFKLNTIEFNFKCKKYIPDKYKKISFLSIPLGYCGTVSDENWYSNDENNRYSYCRRSDLCYYKYGNPFPTKFDGIGRYFSELSFKQVPIVSNTPILWSSKDQSIKHTFNSLRKKVVTDPCPPGFKLPGSDFITALRWELQKGNSKLYGSDSTGYNLCLGEDIRIIGRATGFPSSNTAINFGLCDCAKVGAIDTLKVYAYSLNVDDEIVHQIIPCLE